MFSNNIVYSYRFDSLLLVCDKRCLLHFFAIKIIVDTFLNLIDRKHFIRMLYSVFWLILLKII